MIAQRWEAALGAGLRESGVSPALPRAATRSAKPHLCRRGCGLLKQTLGRRTRMKTWARLDLAREPQPSKHPANAAFQAAGKLPKCGFGPG